MNPSWLTWMNDPGFAYVRREGSRAGLSDIFVYPNLRHKINGGSPKTVDVKGRDAFAFLTKTELTILQGAPFSGKTALSKKLALDVRVFGDKVPIWIDGQTLAAKSIEDFEQSLHLAFVHQYSANSLTSYLQLLPSHRVVIIDDWHLAKLSTSLRESLHSWLRKFAETAILLVDMVYEVKELLSLSSGEDLVGNKANVPVRRVFVGALSNAARASLIQRWRISRGGADPMDVAESSESQRVEDLVRSLLGKDSLPTYPFYVLCVLQALESNKTAALAGGSFGPLFEVLIISSLEKADSQDLDISLRLVFLQEIAFRMWDRGIESISREEIDHVAADYLKRSLYELPVSDFLQDVIAAKMLLSSDNNFSFLYPHYFYYFVARYIRDHIEDENSAFLRASIDVMIDKISSTANATIVMFLVYFEREKHRIIDRLVNNATVIFKSVPEAALENDALPFSRVQSMFAPPSIGETSNIAENRVRFNEQLDDVQPSEHPDEAPLSFNRDGYIYDESLTDMQKIHLTQQTIAALGQVIRNFSANLDGGRKIKVLKQTYLLGLRALGQLMTTFAQYIDKIKDIEMSPSSKISVTEFRTQVNQMLIAIVQLYAVFTFENVSNQIGVLKMETAYKAAMKEIDQTTSIRLIDVTVRMHHFETFPESEIRDLYATVKSNKFTLGILQWLVGSYLFTHRVDGKTRKSMSKLFNFDRAALESGEVS